MQNDLAKRGELSEIRDEIKKSIETKKINRIEHIPFLGNPNFTGRILALYQIKQSLHKQEMTAIARSVSISGLGGVGKSQLAIQYAYSNRKDYDVIWWLNAEGPIILSINYSDLTKPLNLPEQHERNQEVKIRAVKNWLNEHDRWLLIFDNAQSPEVVRPYLPINQNGHVLITSRNPNWQALIGSSALSLDVWQRSESMNFLLKRTNREDTTKANRLAEALGDLPLALEQAGAYIVATGCSLSRYLDMLQVARRSLLEREKPIGYQETVATTWEISFRRIQKRMPEAMHLLQLFAFLAPEEIPFEKILGALLNLSILPAQFIKRPLAADDAVALLREYSLVQVRRDLLSVHQLVQNVTRDRLSTTEFGDLLKVSTRVINALFPKLEARIYDSVGYRMYKFHDAMSFWRECNVVLPQAVNTIAHVEKHAVISEEESDLLNKIGHYYDSRDLTDSAARIFRRAIKVGERAFGIDHPKLVAYIHDLVMSLDSQGKYDEAESLCRRALKISEEELGKNHPAVADSLEILAWHLGKNVPQKSVILFYFSPMVVIFKVQIMMLRARRIVKRQVSVSKKQLGPEHLEVARWLIKFADRQRSAYWQNSAVSAYWQSFMAPRAYRRALSMLERQLGPDHLEVADCLIRMGHVHEKNWKFVKAGRAYRRALTILEMCLGPDHLDVATFLTEMAQFLMKRRRFAQAETAFRRALKIFENQLEPDHPRVAINLELLSDCLHKRPDYTYMQIEILERRAYSIVETCWGPNSGAFVRSLSRLAYVTKQQGRFAEAESLNRRALKIFLERPTIRVTMWEAIKLLSHHIFALLAQGRIVDIKALPKEVRPVASSIFTIVQLIETVTLFKVLRLLFRQFGFQLGSPFFRYKAKALKPTRLHFARAILIFLVCLSVLVSGLASILVVSILKPVIYRLFARKVETPGVIGFLMAVTGIGLIIASDALNWNLYWYVRLLIVDYVVLGGFLDYASH